MEVYNNKNNVLTSPSALHLTTPPGLTICTMSAEENGDLPKSGTDFVGSISRRHTEGEQTEDKSQDQTNSNNTRQAEEATGHTSQGENSIKETDFKINQEN